MAQKTIVVNASASLTATGQTKATGSITWVIPSLPEGVDSWDSIVISGMWTWNGKGAIRSLTINGQNTSDSISFSIPLSDNQSSPLTISCVGNKNATGSSFSWSNLVITYTYTEPVSDSNLRLKENGSWIGVQIYKKTNGVWEQVTDPESELDVNIEYIKIEI